MTEVIEKKLTLHNFAVHDPLLDLLHVLNNQENNTKELKELLLTINTQKNKLKQANKEIHDIALFPTQNLDPLIRIDFKGNLLKRNPAAEQLSSFVYDDISYETEDFFKFISTKIDFEKERWIFEAENNHKYYSFVCKSLKEEQYVNIYGRDITLQKKAKEELNRLSLVASLNDNGVLFTEPNGVIVWCNDAYLKLTGFSREEIIGKTPIEIGKSKETCEDDLRKMIDPFYKGEPFDVELLHKRKDGSSFWSKNKGQPILNSKNEVVQYFAMIEDISLKKRYDLSLQNEKEKYRSIIANMNLGLLEVDKNDVITLANHSFEFMSGYKNDELIGKKGSELLLTHESMETFQSKTVLREEGKTDSYEVKIIDKSGKNRYWLISGAPNYNALGELIGSIGIHLDITEKKEIEKKQAFLVKSLAQSNKELEDYASIVSHDLKSPLRSIHSLLSWIKEDNDKQLNDETLNYLSLIESKIEKMDLLIEGILTYSKVGKVAVNSEKVNTHEVIENIIKIIHIPTNINVSIDGQLPIISADRFRIQQLFQNIISNAVNYIDKPAGKVVISCVKNGKQHVFSIKDNGCGIAKENQEKIFKTFQSLGKSHKSTGLGLSIVKKIIEIYNGQIWLESEINKGTTFFISLNS